MLTTAVILLVLLSKTPVEFFGLPFDDAILHEARKEFQIQAVLCCLSGVQYPPESA